MAGVSAFLGPVVPDVPVVPVVPVEDLSYDHPPMSRVPLICLSAFVLLPSAVRAQTPPPDPHAAQPERPTVATHAGTVAPGWVEIEAGAELDRYDGDVSGLAVPVVTK